MNEKSQPIACDACPNEHSCENGHCCPNKSESTCCCWVLQNAKNFVCILDAVCEIDYDTGKYAQQGSHTPRYFYDKKVKNCLLFTYYGALGEFSLIIVCKCVEEGDMQNNI